MNTQNRSVESLRAMAVKQEERLFRRVFSEDERAKMKDAFYARNVELRLLEEDFAVVKAEHKETVQPIEREITSTLGSLRAGFKEETVLCYLVDDQEAGLMNYYDAKTGELVDSRRLLPTERQLNLMNKAE